MAYKNEKLYEEAVRVIKQYNLFMVKDVVAYLGIVGDTFYNHFPTESEESEHIKRLLQENKIKTKVSIRKKLHNCESVAGWLALYKLLATEEELRALSMEYVDHTSAGRQIELPPWLKKFED